MVRDVVVSVGELLYLVDFVVMDMAARNDDFTAPIILGLPFLRTAIATLDYDRMTATLRYRNKSIKVLFSNDQEPEMRGDGFVQSGAEEGIDPTNKLGSGATGCDATEGLTVVETEIEAGFRQWTLANPCNAHDEFPTDNGGWSTPYASMETPEEIEVRRSNWEAELRRRGVRSVYAPLRTW